METYFYNSSGKMMSTNASLYLRREGNFLYLVSRNV